MYRPFIFATGTLCVIAAMSLFRLHLIESQYAAVVLSTPESTSGAQLIQTDGESVTKNPVLFPAPPVHSVEDEGPKSSDATDSTSQEQKTVSTESTAQPERTVVVPIITDAEALNTRARSATVNISCTAPGSSAPASGSGMIIDPRGIILTNAHVAQYLLLQESGHISIDCVIRTGSPAASRYRAEVLYISPEWVRDNAQNIREETSTGTGEHDYALLRITESTTLTPLPSSFPYVPTDVREDAQVPGQSVLISSYPAGFLGGVSSTYNLDLVTTITTIKELFTFSDAHTIDLISLGGIISAQGGSSGGGVVDGSGHLLAIIATSSEADQTADRDLRAVTLFHINKSITRETGRSLNEYTVGDLAQTQATFDAIVAPGLIEQYLDALLSS